MRIKIEKTEFFKIWTNVLTGMRVIKNKADCGFYPYKVQKFDGKVWNSVTSFHTLKEAKTMI